MLYLTKSGFLNYVSEGEELQVCLKSEAKLHDLQLNDLRAALMHSPKIISYSTENQIQTWGDQNEQIPIDIVSLRSDAVAQLKISNETYLTAVELELSDKVMKRYENLVKSYYQTESIDLVLYVAKNKRVLNKLAGIEANFVDGGEAKFFYSLIDPILKKE